MNFSILILLQFEGKGILGVQPYRRVSSFFLRRMVDGLDAKLTRVFRLYAHFLAVEERSLFERIRRAASRSAVTKHLPSNRNRHSEHDDGERLTQRLVGGPGCDADANAHADQ